MRTLLDLILPQDCAGCGRCGVGWCADCAESLAGQPFRVWPRADPGVPCWALGRYAGPRRRAVVAVKEQHRRELAAPLGRELARGLAALRTPRRPLVLVPAPARRAAIRQRGGDPVGRVARVAASLLSDCAVAPVLRMGPGVRDSVGLRPEQRRRNLAGRIVAPTGSLPTALRHPEAEVVLVDDVLTTGATASESVRALTGATVHVRAVVVTCAA
ncbi:ComF family protein [Nocardia sp. alder85J]|uniref:ComF family protein n=1 Tax=Nocardia sp. alder85J TaxID=2862949 RepID=UPI001CD2D561|nr:ComF family protein [Nocardia sp. alder85J]MCX4092148.1 ComF family protein [Nocardia sp. alder85J]